MGDRRHQQAEAGRDHPALTDARDRGEPKEDRGEDL